MLRITYFYFFVASGRAQLVAGRPVWLFIGADRCVDLNNVCLFRVCMCAVGGRRYYGEEVVDMLFELKQTLRSTLAVSLMNG